MNRRAPVRAYVRSDLHKTRDFKNMDEFEDWYRPSHHGDHNKCVNAQYLFTDLLVDSIADAPRGREPKVKGDAPRAPRPVSTKSRVIVDGVEHASVYAAFVALGLPIPKHGKFRKELKMSGELVFEHYGKSHNFKVAG